MTGNENEDLDNGLFPDAETAQAASDAWEGGKSAAAKNQPVGTFQAEILSATFGPSASSGRPQISYELGVLTGPAAGEKVRKYDGMGSDQQARITQQQLERLGVPTKGLKLAQLPAVLLDLTGKKIVCTAKMNGAFYNVYFQKLVTADGPASFAANRSAGGGTARAF